MISEKWITIA